MKTTTWSEEKKRKNVNLWKQKRIGFRVYEKRDRGFVNEEKKWDKDKKRKKKWVNKREGMRRDDLRWKWE